MPEIIKLDDHQSNNDPVNHFLCEAIPFDTFWKVINDREIEVSLIVGGIEIPFVESIRKIYELLLSSVDKTVAEKILEKMQFPQIANLCNRLEEHNDNIRIELEKLFKITMEQ